MKIKFSILFAAVLTLSACSSTGLFLLNSSLKINTKQNVIKDLSFGHQTWQHLDIYQPKQRQDSKLPVIVFFYGGSWDSGRKEMYYFVADAFTKLGYVVVIPDYVKYPQARFPAFIEDGAQAIAWIKKNIASYGGNPEQVFIAGHSAGAHLGGLLLSDGRYLQNVGLSPLDVKGFAGLAGPYNFTPESPVLIDIFGPPENFSNMQAMNFIDGDEPPMLFLHGASDDTVSPLNQDAMIEQLKPMGIQSTAIVYPKLTHISILTSLTPLLRGDSTTLQDIHGFFTQHSLD